MIGALYQRSTVVQGGRRDGRLVLSLVGRDLLERKFETDAAASRQ